jgi:hypothetical protein
MVDVFRIAVALIAVAVVVAGGADAQVRSGAIKRVAVDVIDVHVQLIAKFFGHDYAVQQNGLALAARAGNVIGALCITARSLVGQMPAVVGEMGVPFVYDRVRNDSAVTVVERYRWHC